MVDDSDLVVWFTPRLFIPGLVTFTPTLFTPTLFTCIPTGRGVCILTPTLKPGHVWLGSNDEMKERICKTLERFTENPEAKWIRRAFERIRKPV